VARRVCNPHRSWWRGGLENANGRLRKALPRKSLLGAQTDEDIDGVNRNLNAKPRTGFGYGTPIHAVALPTSVTHLECGSGSLFSLRH
jgi:IS30 family transposase